MVHPLFALVFAFSTAVCVIHASALELDWARDPVRQALAQNGKTVPAVPPATGVKTDGPKGGEEFPLQQKVLTFTATSFEYSASREAALADARTKLQAQIDALGGAGTFGIGARISSAWEVKNLAPSGQVSMQVNESRLCSGCATHYVAMLAQTVQWEFYYCKDLRYLPDGRREARCPSGPKIFRAE